MSTGGSAESAPVAEAAAASPDAVNGAADSASSSNQAAAFASPSPSPPIPDDGSATSDYLTSSASLNFELQVTAPPIDAAMQRLIDELRADISTEPVYRDHPFISAYCTDTLLHRYVRARNSHLPKARALLLETLQWRLSYRPDLILASEVSEEASSGKILTLHYDQYGRPIVLMDNSYNDTHDHAAAIRHLVFHLERAAQRMIPPVEKYCLVVNLERHSFWNAPPISTAIETTRVIMDRYPEHLGSAVTYQPPKVFGLLYAAASPFFDSRMKEKIVWVKGGTEEEGEVDRAMRTVVGDDWKAKCRIDLPPSEPRYDHSKEWPRVVAEQKAWLKAHDRWEEVKHQLTDES